MTATEAELLQRLRDALADATAEPAAQAAALTAARRAAIGTGPLAGEVLARELRWLAREVEALADGELTRAATVVRQDWLAWRARGLAEAPRGDPAAYFDLAEVGGLLRCAGDVAAAERCFAALRDRAPAVAAEPRAPQEARERLAVLAAAGENVPLVREVALLRAEAEAMALLAAAGLPKPAAALARRLRRAADDRELARRREGVFGRRGVAAIEATNLVLLVVVLTTLVVEALVPLTPAQSWLLHAIDAAACCFFVVDFFVQFALHPARGGWFLRNVLTDLLPAIPAVLWLLPVAPVPGVAQDAVLLRWIRIVRVTWAARYLQAMRPLVRTVRLVVFLVRGMDGLVERFAGLLDRDFVFVPGKRDLDRPLAEEQRRDLAYTAQRREQDLVALLPPAERVAAVRERLARVRDDLAVVPLQRADGELGNSSRDIAIDRAIELLWTLRPQDLSRWLRPGDLAALDRVVRVLSSVPVRWLPIVRSFAVVGNGFGPEERVVQLGRRIAAWLDGWHSRLLFHADLHGIVTGPQILDRIATALVKATQRPTLRLFLIGGILALFGKERFSEPLLILGAICLGLFSLGLWLKRIAGEAAEAYRLTSEAHFLSQVELVKRRYEAQDLPFLARRVFGGEVGAEVALRAQLGGARAGVPALHHGAEPALCIEANRVALLYLHFLDGAPLHVSDVKSTEQLLANQSIANLRVEFLGHGRKEQQKLRQLRLDEGSIFRGPYLWFRFITESIAVETAKRIAGYNHCCIPLAMLPRASEDDLARMRRWLAWRQDPRGGRAIGAELGLLEAQRCQTTEFTALDFVGADPERDCHIAAMFGREVLDVLRRDRRTMIREIFGTRPVHRLPKHERSFNPLRLYRAKLSGGRVLFAPLLLGWRFLRSLGWVVGRTRQIVREVFHPELAMELRELGEAPFAVALRKIHRMRAPGLLAAMRLRLALDPVYAGAPAGWSNGAGFVSPAPLEHDLQFLQLREREAAELRDLAASVREQVASLHAQVAAFGLDRLVGEQIDGAPAERAAAELAVTAAWLANRGRVRDLCAAERWRVEQLPRLLGEGLPATMPTPWWPALLKPFRVDRLDLLLQRHGVHLPRTARRLLLRARAGDWQGVRQVLAVWAEVPPGVTPGQQAEALFREVAGRGIAVRRDLLTLRAVQSLGVLDVRNHRDLVFQLGEYASEGENPELGSALPAE
jgi:hypothetical protein